MEVRYIKVVRFTIRAAQVYHIVLLLIKLNLILEMGILAEWQVWQIPLNHIESCKLSRIIRTFCKRSKKRIPIPTISLSFRTADSERLIN